MCQESLGTTIEPSTSNSCSTAGWNKRKYIHVNIFKGSYKFGTCSFYTTADYFSRIKGQPISHSQLGYS